MAVVEPLYDEMGIPLTRSGVSERIWALFKTDPAAFKRQVTDYFALAYPGFTVAKANYPNRIIWLKDERRQRINENSNARNA